MKTDSFFLFEYIYSIIRIKPIKNVNRHCVCTSSKDQMCSTWVLTLKFPNTEWKLYRYCLIEVDFVDTVTILLSMKKRDRIRFCELSKTGLHLSYFFPPPPIWHWGNKEKKRGYILHTDIWKILSFSLKITTTWSWSQVWKESCSYLPFWNPQRHTVLRKLLFHCSWSQLSSKDWASSSSKLHGIGELHKWYWKWVRVVGLEDEVSRKTCTGYICVSFTSCHECSF